MAVSDVGQRLRELANEAKEPANRPMVAVKIYDEALELSQRANEQAKILDQQVKHIEHITAQIQDERQLRAEFKEEMSEQEPQEPEEMDVDVDPVQDADSELSTQEQTSPQRSGKQHTNGKKEHALNIFETPQSKAASPMVKSEPTAVDEPSTPQAVVESKLRGQRPHRSVEELIGADITELELFTQKDGEDGYRELLGVASYPATDLQDVLAKLPDKDFSNVKPTQVPLKTFESFQKPFFEDFNEESLQLLEEKAVGALPSYSLSPYIIPPLGPLYTESWNEDEQPRDLANGTGVGSLAARRLSAKYTPLGSKADMTSDNLVRERVAPGPLMTRLLSLMMPQAKEDPPVGSLVVSEELKNNTRPNVNMEFSESEERLRLQLKEAGLIDRKILLADARNKREFKLAVECSLSDYDEIESLDEVDWPNCEEDDEICRDLRQLQDRLATSAAMNRRYKRRLLPVVRKQLAWQQYSSVLDDIDKRIMDVYNKLYAPKKKKKQSDGLPIMTPPQEDQLRDLFSQRRRWISIAHLFGNLDRAFEVSKFDGIDKDSDSDPGI